jgi:hypothetical protein
MIILGFGILILCFKKLTAANSKHSLWIQIVIKHMGDMKIHTNAKYDKLYNYQHVIKCCIVLTVPKDDRIIET